MPEFLKQLTRPFRSAWWRTNAAQRLPIGIVVAGGVVAGLYFTSGDFANGAEGRAVEPTATAEVAARQRSGEEDRTAADPIADPTTGVDNRSDTDALASLEDFERRLRREEQEHLDKVLRPIRGVTGTVRLDFDRSVVDEERVLRPATDRVRSRRESIEPVVPRDSGETVSSDPGRSQAATTEDIEYDTTPDGVRRMQHRMPRVSGMSVMLQISTEYTDLEAGRIAERIESQYPQVDYPILVQYLPADPALIDEIRGGVGPTVASPVRPEIGTGSNGAASGAASGAAAGDEATDDGVATYLPWVFRLGTALGAFAILYLILRRSSPKRASKAAESQPTPAEPELDPMLARRVEVERQFERDPNTVSRVLESWLMEARN